MITNYTRYSLFDTFANYVFLVGRKVPISVSHFRLIRLYIYDVWRLSKFVRTIVRSYYLNELHAIFAIRHTRELRGNYDATFSWSGGNSRFPLVIFD